MSDDKTLKDLVESAFAGLEALLNEFDLPLSKDSLAAFTIVYGVNTPDGGIAIGHSTPENLAYDTPLVLRKVSEILHQENASRAGWNN